MLNNGIIKGATVTDASTGGFNLATATGATTASISALPAASYTVLPATGASPTANYIATASTALTTSETVNALLIRGDNITISGVAGTTLTVGGASGSAGMLVTSGGTTTGDTISVPTLALGTQEGVFITNNGTTTISSNITGSGGATFSVGGTLALTGTNTYTNTSAVQTLTITGTPTSGTFSLSFNGAVTTPILYNATAANIQAALQGLPNIGPNNVTVTGTNPGPFTITFVGILAGANLPLLAVAATLLNHGATVATASTTTGVTDTTLNRGTLTLGSADRPRRRLAVDRRHHPDRDRFLDHDAFQPAQPHHPEQQHRWRGRPQPHAAQRHHRP